VTKQHWRLFKNGANKEEGKRER